MNDQGRAPGPALVYNRRLASPGICADMIVLEGLPALSPFRRDRLQNRLQQIVPGLRVTGAWHAYFVEPGPGASPDLAALGRILEGCTGSEPLADGAQSRYVVPRLGTLSPWSSKATEIVQGAGLAVKRVERGLRLDLAGLPPAGDPRWPKLARALHDPMTQSLLATREEAAKVGREVDGMAVSGIGHTGKRVPHQDRTREVITRFGETSLDEAGAAEKLVNDNFETCNNLGKAAYAAITEKK